MCACSGRSELSEQVDPSEAKSDKSESKSDQSEAKSEPKAR